LIPVLTRITKSNWITIAKEQLVVTAIGVNYMQLRFGHLGSSKNQNFTPNFSWIRLHNKYPTAKYSKFLDAGFVIINFLFSARILQRQLQMTSSDVPFYHCSRAQCLKD
jgi:hypothetical protein